MATSCTGIQDLAISWQDLAILAFLARSNGEVRPCPRTSTWDVADQEVQYEGVMTECDGKDCTCIIRKV